MLSEDFKEFLRLLNSEGVEYLVVGGYALAVHGHPRYTGDLDVWVGRDSGNIERLMRALHGFGFGSLGIRAEDFAVENSVVQLGYPPFRIDLLSSIDGVGFGESFARRVIHRVDDIDMPVIGLAEFRANKIATGRLKDLADVEAIDASVKPSRKH